MLEGVIRNKFTILDTLDNGAKRGVIVIRPVFLENGPFSLNFIIFILWVYLSPRGRLGSDRNRPGRPVCRDPMENRLP